MKTTEELLAGTSRPVDWFNNRHVGQIYLRDTEKCSLGEIHTEDTAELLMRAVNSLGALLSLIHI